MEQQRLAALLRTKLMEAPPHIRSAAGRVTHFENASRLGDASEEMKQFRERMLKETPGEIYGSAYQIDTKWKICEILLEMSQRMKEDELQVLLGVPNLLAFLYCDWILSKFEDGGTDVIRASIVMSMQTL